MSKSCEDVVKAIENLNSNIKSSLTSKFGSAMVVSDGSNQMEACKDKIDKKVDENCQAAIKAVGIIEEATGSINVD